MNTFNPEGSRRSRRIQQQQQAPEVDSDESSEEEAEAGEAEGGEAEGGEAVAAEEEEEETEEQEEAEAAESEQQQQQPEAPDEAEPEDPEPDEDDEGEEDDDDDDDDDESRMEEDSDSDKQTTRTGTSTPVASNMNEKSSTEKFENKPLEGPIEDLVHDTVMYLLLQHHKKTPVKRADIIHIPMHKDKKHYGAVMTRVAAVFHEIFGIDLVGIGEQSKGRMGGFGSYILCSKYQMAAVRSVVEIQITEEMQLKKVVLMSLLAIIFMQGRPLEDETIWKIFTELQVTDQFCKKKDDLRKFLKQEYVNTMYLHVDENKETEQIQAFYSWGIRAEKEFGKYWLLKFVAGLFPDKKVEDFAAQYGMVMESEREIVLQDKEDMENNRIEEELEETLEQEEQDQQQYDAENNELEVRGAGIKPDVSVPDVGSLTLEEGEEQPPQAPPTPTPQIIAPASQQPMETEEEYVEEQDENVAPATPNPGGSSPGTLVPVEIEVEPEREPEPEPEGQVEQAEEEGSGSGSEVSGSESDGHGGTEDSESSESDDSSDFGNYY